jgi:flagellar biogenesis protein FliO
VAPTARRRSTTGAGTQAQRRGTRVRCMKKLIMLLALVGLVAFAAKKVQSS